MPIPIPNNEIKHEICRLVDIAQEKLEESPSIDIMSIKKTLDIIIYHLYNLTYQEVLVIEPKISISKEEYENFKIGK